MDAIVTAEHRGDIYDVAIGRAATRAVRALAAVEPGLALIEPKPRGNENPLV